MESIPKLKPAGVGIPWFVPDEDKTQVAHDIFCIIEQVWDHKNGQRIQVRPVSSGNYNLARLIAAAPELYIVCCELAREPYDDSDIESLFRTLQARARQVLGIEDDDADA